MFDGLPDKLEFHILHHCSLDFVGRVENICIVEQFSKRRRISAHTSIRSQLGYELEQMISSRLYQQQLLKYFSTSISVDIQESHHLKIVDFLVTSNNAFNVYCNKELEMFIHRINPNYILPSRRLVLDRLLQKHYNECLLKLEEELKNASDVRITMDGWEDMSNNLIYAVMTITKVIQWILNIVHFIGRSTANALQQ